MNLRSWNKSTSINLCPCQDFVVEFEGLSFFGTSYCLYGVDTQVASCNPMPISKIRANDLVNCIYFHMCLMFSSILAMNFISISHKSRPYLLFLWATQGQPNIVFFNVSNLGFYGTIWTRASNEARPGSVHFSTHHRHFLISHCHLLHFLLVNTTNHLVITFICLRF